MFGAIMPRPVSGVTRNGSVLFLVVATLAGAPAAAAEIGVTDTVARSRSGIRVMRSETLGAPLPISTPPARTGATTSRRGTGGQVLWVDSDHMDAVPGHAAISGDGAFVVVGWWLNNERAALYSADGDGIPEWTFPITTSFYVPVDASHDGGTITATGRQDVIYTWDASSGIPVCVAPHPPGYEGAGAYTPPAGDTFAGTASFAGGLASAQAQASSGCGQAFVDPAVSGQVQGGRYAAGGDYIAINTRALIQVYDDATGDVRGTAPIPGETQAPVGISGDAGILADGGFSATLYVYTWNGTAYEELWTHTIPDITWITAVDVSDDGSTIMVGAWLSPAQGRVLLYDVNTGPTPLWTSSGFADYISSVDLDANGSRGIAGSWGDAEGSEGHLIAVFDRTSVTPIFAIGDDEIPGVSSCYTVELSQDGTRAAAGGKAIHARELGSGGYGLAIEIPTATPVADPLAPVSGITLGAGRPNPFTRATTIPFALGDPGVVQLVLFDGGGRRVRAMDLGARRPGHHDVEWDRLDDRDRRVPSGVYFYTIDVAGRSTRAAARARTHRLVVLD